MEALRKVPVEKVKIDSGFWQNRQRINAEVTLDVVLKRLKETGRIDGHLIQQIADPHPVRR